MDDVDLRSLACVAQGGHYIGFPFNECASRCGQCATVVVIPQLKYLVDSYTEAMKDGEFDRANYLRQKHHTLWKCLIEEWQQRSVTTRDYRWGGGGSGV